MECKVKLLENGLLPEKKTKGAACYDCYARNSGVILRGETVIVPLGFAIEVPDNYYVEITGRSGRSSKGMAVITGKVDSDYRGEVGAIIVNLSKNIIKFEKGERVAQMQIKTVLDTELITVDKLSDTQRGANGFGSTGK